MKNINLKAITIVAATMCATPSYAGQWSEVKTSTSGELYVTVDAIDRADNTLAVYANPSSSCSLTIVMFDFFYDNDKARALGNQKSVAKVQYRIDKHDVWDNATAEYSVTNNDGTLTTIAYKSAGQFDWGNDAEQSDAGDWSS